MTNEIITLNTIINDCKLATNDEVITKFWVNGSYEGVSPNSDGSTTVFINLDESWDLLDVELLADDIGYGRDKEGRKDIPLRFVVTTNSTDYDAEYEGAGCDGVMPVVEFSPVD